MVLKFLDLAFWVSIFFLQIMTIHAQICSESHGFSSMRSQNLAEEHWRGGGGGGIGQFCPNPLQKQQWREWEEQKENHKPCMGTQIQNQNLNPSFARNFQDFPSKYTSGAAINDQTPQQFYQSIAPHVEIETADLGQYINSQNETLRWALQEQVKRHVSSVLSRLESKTTFLLREKEEQIVQAKKNTMELQEFLRKLEIENQAWRRFAQETEAMVISLNNTLDQMRETASLCVRSDAAEDAVSRCVGETKEATMDANRGRREWPAICSWCNAQNSSLLFLPSKHLGSCQACEAVLDSCPVCFAEKSSGET